MFVGLLLAANLYGGDPEEEVLVLTKPGVIVMPGDKTVAALQEIEAMPEVMDALQFIRTEKIRKAMPGFYPADTVRIAPDGTIARLPNFSNLFAFQLPDDSGIGK